MPSLKDAIRSAAVVNPAWSAFRRRQLSSSYERRREEYAARAAALRIRYDAEQVIADVRRDLRQRRTPPRRRRGDVHTFAFVPDFSWHKQLLGDLGELGAVTWFDYVGLGYTWTEFTTAAGVERRRAMNDAFVAEVERVHRQRPIDWIFVYASGYEVLRTALERIRTICDAPIVNMCLDDKHSWEGPRVGEQRSGQIEIASAFDLSWTSARVALEWYLVEGARPVYLPEGFDHASVRQPADGRQDIPVSFVGQAYGFRPAVVRHLRRMGIPIQLFGHGWKDGSPVADVNDVFFRSIINLGMGGIGYREDLTNVKGRDFEITGAGGGMYLTTFNSDLAQHFDVGREIVCYANRDELVELIRYHLTHVDETRAIALRARERSVREHRWLHRYERICRILEVMD